MSPPPLRGEHSQSSYLDDDKYQHGHECGRSSMEDVMLLIASSARAFADADDGQLSNDANSPNPSPPTSCATPTTSTDTRPRKPWGSSTGKASSVASTRQSSRDSSSKTASSSRQLEEAGSARRSRKVSVKPLLSMPQRAMAQRAFPALEHTVQDAGPDSPKQPGIAYSPSHTPRSNAPCGSVSMHNKPCYSPRDSRGRHLWS